MSALSDFTNAIERFEVFEERAGVTLEGLSAVLEHDEDRGLWQVSVCGELHARGAQLVRRGHDTITCLYATAHDLDGRMLGQSLDTFQHETFFGFEPFQITVHSLIREPVKIRIYPK